MDYYHDDSFDDDEDYAIEIAQSEEDIQEEGEDGFHVDEDRLGCKRIFHIPFEPVWYYFMVFVAVSQIFIAIFEAGFKKYGKPDGLSVDFTVFKYVTSGMYAIDVVLLIGGKHVEGLLISPTEIRRPNWVLIADIISIVPIQFLIPMRPLTPFKAKFYYSIQLISCLKAVRIFHTLHHRHYTVGTSKIGLQICEYYFSMGVAVMIGFVMTYKIMCNENDCPDYPTSDEYIEYLYISVSKISTRGMADYPTNLYWKAGIGIIGYIVFMFISCASIAFVAIALHTMNYHQYQYLYKLKLVHAIFAIFETPKVLNKQCLDFFDLFWQFRSGNTPTYSNFEELTLALYDEISLDISWPALKHSKLLRTMDIPFLRHVALHVQSIFMLPDQIIYSNDCPKDMMIYVVSGVIQILSNEDDETPILSFSAGTCLGESSLIWNYQAKTIVRCKTVCIIHVLESRNFIKLMGLFPEQFAKLREEFQERLVIARKYHELSKTAKHNHGVMERTDYITGMWIKSTLHKLMSKDGDEGHQCQNIFLRDELNNEKFVDRHFTAQNLDMLAISERLELITDTVFLKTSCPCVFQPLSPILYAWDSVITLFAIFSALIIPYYALVEPTMPLWYIICVHVITILWNVDLYMSISTGTKRDEEIVADVVRIFLVKIASPEFLLNLFAGIPLELLASILVREISPQHIAFLRLNRILKIWRIKTIFHKQDQQLNANRILVRYMEYCSILIFTSYLFSCMLFSMNCFNHECLFNNTEEDHMVQLLWTAEIVTHILTGVGTPSRLYDKMMYYPSFLFLTVVSTAFFTFIYGSMAGEYDLNRVSENFITEIFINIVNTLKSRGLSKEYYKRIFSYVDTQWMDNYGSKLLYKTTPMCLIPRHILKLFRESINREFLLAVPMFRELSDRVLIDLCNVSKIAVFPPNEIVCYTGDVNNTIYIIAKGYCKVVSGMMEGILGPGDSLNILEACLGVPVVNTVITTTHCRVVLIDDKSLRNIYLKYPVFKEEIVKAFKDCELKELVSSEEIGSVGSTDENDRKSFFTFGYNIEVDSFKEYDYFIPFDRLGVFSFVQYFLLRWTILPESRFLYGWEIGRSACAALSAIFFSYAAAGTCTHCYWYFLLIILDAMAWADIYVRLHVCYYNTNGILITHPLSTAKHYLTHGFLVDIIAVFPVRVLFPAHLRHHNDTLSLLQLNRLLQMYRYMGFFNYIETRTFWPKRNIAVIKYFPILLIICVCVGSFLIHQICSFKDNIPQTPIFGKGVSCGNQTWITKSHFKKPLSATRVNMYAIYFATSFLTLCGMDGFKIRSTIIAVYGLPLSIVAYILNVHIVSTAISSSTGNYSTRFEYQSAINGICDYMKHFKVRSDLQKKVIAYCVLKWLRKRDRKIQNVIERLPRPLQQDILYDIYGRILEEATVFQSDSKLFLRNLVEHVHHEVAISESNIINVNDVNSNIHIIYKGKACVLAPDGTTITTLFPGSFYGNLDNCDMTRQTISVVALGHVEFLKIRTLKYHKLLSKYPQLNREYASLIAMHIDFIKCRKRLFLEESDLNTNLKSRIPFINVVFYPEHLAIRIWRALILVGVCYFAVCFGFYQSAMAEYSLAFVIFQYTCDVLYAMNYYVVTHLAYENDFGAVVTNLKLIKKRFYQNRTVFWCCIIGMVPFDVFAWFAPNNIFPIIYPLLRGNRLVRFVYFIYNFNQQKQKLSDHLQLMRVLYILIWSSFILHCSACILIVLSCTHSPSMHPAIQCHTTMTTLARFKIYIDYCYIIISSFTRTTQTTSYPESQSLTIFCIFLMIFFQLISAIFMAQVYTVIKKKFYHQSMYDRNLEIVSDYMAREHLSDSLFKKASEYLMFLWRKRRGESFPRLLLEAPHPLREMVLGSAFGAYINNHFMFQKCHVDFNRQVIACLRNETFFKDDYIVYQGTMRGSMYFVHSGEVVVLSEDSMCNETMVETLKPGASFGVTPGLFPTVPYAYTFRANKVTAILRLDFEMWKHLLRFFPASKQMLRTRYGVYNDKFA